jgi:hypothetical protein
MINGFKSSLVIGFLSAMVLMSCSPTPQRVSGSDLAIKFVEGPDIKASEDLTFLVINMSTACIEFPDDFGIKIYYLDKNDAWVETNNLGTYLHPQNNKLEPYGNPLDLKAVYVRPRLSTPVVGNPIAMRVTIKGNICNDPTTIVEKEIPFTVTP